MTWIDVVDTAVKIGLGALVAGLFGYTIAKLGHDRDARGRYAKRRRDKIEKVLDLLNDFENKRIHQTAYFRSYLMLKTVNAEKAQLSRKRFEEIDEEFRVTFEKFTEASGILLLLGESESESALQAYREIADDWYAKSIPDWEEMTEDRVSDLLDSIKGAREKLFAELAKSYRSE